MTPEPRGAPPCDTLPVEVKVGGRLVVVFGGDAECAAKVERSLEAGAVVRVVARGDVAAAIEAHAAAGRVELVRRPPTRADFDGAAVAFVAGDEEELGRGLHEAARSAGRLVCCLDRPATSTFINPSVFSVGGLRISLSSGGRSPGLLRQLRHDLSELFGDPRFAPFLEALAELRRQLPRGARSGRMRDAVAGFRVRGTLEFPRWFTPPAPPAGDGDGAAGDD